MPLVSVLIPTFNRAHSLARCLDSALSQTHRNLEVVLVDDGSTDGTRELVASRYAADGRVRYIYQPHRGVSPARNTGLAATRGEFIALLDSDDVWLHWKIELQLACMARFPEVGMIWTDMQGVDPEGEVFDPRYIRAMYSAYRHFALRDLFPDSSPLAEIAPQLAAVVGDARLHRGRIFSQMIMGNLVHTPTAMVRRERLQKVGGFNESLRFAGGDFDFHLRTCREGPVAYIDLPTIRYQRGMPDRLTRREYRVHSARNFLDTILPFIEGARAEIDLPDPMIDAVLAEGYIWLADAQVERGELRAARQSFLRSLRHDPFQPRALLLLAASFLPGRVFLGLQALWGQLKRKVAALWS